MAGDKVVIPIELSVTDIKTGDVDLKDVEKSIASKMSTISKSAGDVLGKIDTSKLNKTLTTAMDKVTTSYNNLAVAQTKANDALASAGSSSPHFKKELQSIQAEIAKTERLWQDLADMLLKNPVLENAMDKVANTGDVSSLSGAEKNAFDFYNKAYEDYENKMTKLQNSMPDPRNFVDSATTTELQKVVTEYYRLFEAVNKVKTATDNWNKAKESNQLTDDYMSKVKELEALEKKLISVRDKADKMSAVGAGDKSWKNLQYDATVLEQKIVQIVAEMREMVNTGSAFRFDTGDSAKELDYLKNSLSNLSKNMQQIRSSSGQTKSNILSLVKAIDNFGKSASIGIGRTINLFRKLGKTTATTSKDMSKSIRKLWKDILMFGFGVRSTFFLVRRLRRVFIESFQEMAKQIPEINADLSSFIKSLNQIKGSLATAFQPIVSFIIPSLNQLMASLNNAANAIGRFFATLTGQGYIYKYTAAQVDYAKSLDKTAGSAKKAQKSLMGFDEINRLDDNSGSGGDVPTGMWEKEMLNGVNSLAEMLKKAWKDADFTEVGQYLGQKLLDALIVADKWLITKGYALAEKIGKSLATLINGFISTDGLAPQIGKTIADAFNTAMIGLNTFLKTTDWINLGQFIADWANSSVLYFKWNLLGQTVANAITAAVNTWWKFVGEFDFSQLGNKIAVALNNMFSNLLSTDDMGLSTAGKLGQAITNTVRGILTTLTEAINKTDWTSVGQAIGEVLANIDWSGIIIDFTELVKAIVKALAESLRSWSEVEPIGAAIASLIGLGFLTVKTVPAMATIIGAFMKFRDAVSPIVWGLIDAFGKLGTFLINIGKYIGSFFQSVGGMVKSAMSVITPTIAAGAAIIAGLVTAFANFFDMLANGFNWVKEIIMVLGVAIATVGVIILAPIEGVGIAIAAIVGALVATVMTVVVLVKENWQAICDFVVTSWTTMTTFIVETWNNFVLLLQTGLELLSVVWMLIWTNIVTFVVNIWTSIVTTISMFVTNLQLIITNAITAISTWWTTAWTAISQFTSNIWASITNVINTAINSVRTFITSGMSGIQSAWSSGWNAIKAAATSIWAGITSTIRTAINGIIGFVNGMIRGITSGINSVIGLLNNFKVDIPDWVPEIGGKSFGFSLSTISAPQIPMLAKGGVIPPNNEFMAILGDQKSGTNIEAPLDTIKQAVGEELLEYIDAMMTGFQSVVQAINEKDLDVQIGDNAIGKAAERYSRRQALVRGTT